MTSLLKQAWSLTCPVQALDEQLHVGRVDLKQHVQALDEQLRSTQLELKQRVQAMDKQLKAGQDELEERVQVGNGGCCGEKVPRLAERARESSACLGQRGGRTSWKRGCR